MNTRRFALAGLTAALMLLGTASYAGAREGQITRDQRANAPISNLVTVPPGHSLTFIAGTSAGSEGTVIPEGADTEAQVTTIYEKIRGWLAKRNLTLGDIVMLRVHLSPDPKTGNIDAKGAHSAYLRYFGTAEQPNLPARVTLPTHLHGNTLAEIEAIAAAPARR